MLHGCSSKAGRPTRKTSGELVLAKTKRKEYRVHAEVVLLTYSGFAGLEHFHRFVGFVRGCLKKWGVKRWGTTLEAYETEGLHAHLVLQFASLVDRTVSCFAFEGTQPNVSNGDYLGEGLLWCFDEKNKHYGGCGRKPEKKPHTAFAAFSRDGCRMSVCGSSSWLEGFGKRSVSYCLCQSTLGLNKKRMQLCTDRGFFYVWADKVGTQRESDGRPCFEGNHVMASQEYTLQFHLGPVPDAP